jgi:hypothetical protein
MTSRAPEMGPCRLMFRYEIRYIRRRCRKTSTAHLHGLADISIRTIAETDAPVAFSVTTPAQDSRPASFDVREFEDACWWPIGDEQGFVSVQQFLDALADGDLGYLTLLYKSGFNSHLGPWKETRVLDLDARKIVSPNLDEKLRLAHRGAERFLFCGDRVFVKGQDPVYCCVLPVPEAPLPKFTVDVADPERRPLSKENPCLRPLGSGPCHFYESATRGTVFRADEKEKLAAFLTSRGIESGFSPDIKVMLPQNIRSNPLQIQVAALVKVLNRLISLRGVSAESEYFRQLFNARARLRSIAAQEKIEIDEGASVLAQFSIWCAHSGTIERYDPNLAWTFDRFAGPIHDVLKKVSTCYGSPPGSSIFLDKSDERALSGLGA